MLPASDDRVATVMTLAETGERIGFQDYFVRHRHDVRVAGVTIEGAAEAVPSPAVRDALDADLVIIAPSNPIVSIEPLLAVGDVRSRLRDRSDPVVGISPIVGGAAVKGPAARLLNELGHDVSALGVSRLGADLLDVLVVDDADAGLARPIAATGVTPYVTDTIMATPERAANLARATLSAAGVARRPDG